MKKLFLVALLIPLMISAQEVQEYGMFTNLMLTAHPEKISEFEAGLAAHNKKFHSEGPFQANVFFVMSGKNFGKYIWSMGPNPWSAMDNAPQGENGHNDDWNKNVAANALAESDVTYWKLDTRRSNFTQDFTLKNLAVFMLDIKRFKGPEFSGVLDKVTEVFKAKDGNEQWGVYFNELANADGRDMAWVNFYDKSSWMSREDKFPQWYEEVHGEGSFKDFLSAFDDTTHQSIQELWVFRPDLSGSDGSVESANRQ
ncbi:hypothetical protein [Flagellimonas myxillae]|uniref:hypothetical protein n=1 Tax=Flagellimonas myxillae TaxID=2942214 RepID=UPI00201EC324|nr:hypothetical protein [Muricauda myxillae]MCL6265497.1 hypothetical protein [Muricauda myxillae]